MQGYAIDYEKNRENDLVFRSECCNSIAEGVYSCQGSGERGVEGACSRRNYLGDLGVSGLFGAFLSTKSLIVSILDRPLTLLLKSTLSQK